MLWASMAMFMLLVYFSYNIPNTDRLYDDFRKPTVKLLSQDNKLIAQIGDVYGDFVNYEDMPHYLIDAVTSTEDRRFFDHFGLDVFGLVRAFYVNMKAGRVVQGGSTITQQLAKVVFLTPDRTIERKIKEVLFSIYLERRFTKEEIMTMYLNRIYFGSGNYGISAAAWSYFDKKVKDLTLYESAILAGLIKAPSRYSPLNNAELSRQRADQVIQNMIENNKITTEQLLLHSFGKEEFKVGKGHLINNSYFSDWINEQLADYAGAVNGDITVKTTLDTGLQKLAEKTLNDYLDKFGRKDRISQGAMVVLSPDGQVLAMVGGRDYRESQFNRVTQAYRQPGSAFKLFVYLAALEKGYLPDDILSDEAVDIDGWSPKNWDRKHVGNVSLRDAFANSINSIAVKLTKDVGLPDIIGMARRLGITSDINNDLSSALGTSEVTLLELAGAYAHLANFGKPVWIHGILEITDKDGSIVYQRQESENPPVISIQSTAEMNELLVNVIDEGTGKNAKIDREVAGKTGTSQNSKDAWFIGFTTNYVVGVWVGNDDNAPMDKVGGGGVPAKIWKNFMEQANKNKPDGKIATTYFSVSKGLQEKQSISSIIDDILGIFSNK